MSHVSGVTDRRAIRPYVFTNRFLQLGYNGDVDNLDPPMEVWSVEGALINWPSVAAPVDLVSDDANDTVAGTGARAVQLIGVDALFGSLKEEVSLNGLTPVSSSNDFLFVNEMEVSEIGSSGLDTNLGIITGEIGGDTVVQIEAGAGSSEQALLTVPSLDVPSNTQPHLIRILASVVATPTRSAIIRFLKQEQDGSGAGPVKTIATIPVMSRAGGVDLSVTPITLEPGTRIWARILDTDGGNNAQVNAGFEVAWW